MNETVQQRGLGMMFNQGGQVPGRGPNKDTVPAVLTPGEFVMSRDAVDKWGLDTFAGMNAAGGGTNKIKKDKDGVTYANAGGLVSGTFGGKKDKTPNVSGDGTSNKDMGNEPSAIAGIAEGVPYTFEQQLQTMIIRHKWRTEELNEAIQSGQGVESTKRRHARATRGLIKYTNNNPKVVANLSVVDKKYVDLLVKSDPLPTQTPTRKKLVETLGDTSSTPRTGGGGSISGSSGTPPPLLPIKSKSTVVTYNNLKSKQGGKTSTLNPSQGLPSFDAAAMNSQAKIKVLGISV